MNPIGKMAMAVTFTFTCFTVPVLGADAVVSKPAVTGSGDATSRKATVEKATVEKATVGKAEWATVMADQIKQLQEQFKKEQGDLLTKYRELLKQARDGNKEVREAVREQFKARMTDLVSRQQELREDLKRRFEEFRAENPQHQELIDAAKERVKERLRDRRGHGGE